jgi:hypothetical protein
MDCLGSCNTCSVYNSLSAFCTARVIEQIPSLPKSFRLRHLFFTTLSAPLDFAYRMYFYTIRLFIVIFKPELLRKELQAATPFHYFFTIASVVNEMFLSLKYTIIVCALTGDAFHNEKRAAMRLLALYSELNNRALPGREGQYQVHERKITNWWRLPFESAKCSATPFSHHHVFNGADSGEVRALTSN